MDASTIDMTQPVQVAPGTWWVGKRDPRSIFHSNTYLRIFERVKPDGQRQQFNVLIDPGSQADFATVASKVTRLLGGLDRISLIHINHQDPDVGSSAPLLLARHAPRAHILASEDTWRLISHLGLPRDRFVSADRHNGTLKLPTGHVLRLVPTPFCHFRGALCLYDPETRVFFSGDLLGGLNPEGELSLEALGSEWPGIRAFHQLYMPTRSALSRAVSTIRALQPEVQTIAPQHGRVLRGELMAHFLERLSNLPVGLDLLDESNDTLIAWTHVLQRLLKTARELLGAQIEQRLADDPQLQDTIEYRAEGPQVRAAGRSTVERVLELLTADETPGVANLLKMEAVGAAEQLQLPAPRVSLDEGEGPRIATPDDLLG